MTKRRGTRGSAPATCRWFGHRWHEIEYLHSKLEHWLHVGNRRNAARYVERLEACLRAESESHLAILGEMCWSLLAEFRGDLHEATRFLQNAMDLEERLVRETPDIEDPDLNRSVKGDHLQPRLYKRLAEFYREQDNLAAAREVLRTARDLCERVGVPFRATTLLTQLERRTGSTE